ncbi:MAG TPA: LEPR-XLL domain-containing protein, partial [Tepidisphaeraceae bacterium]|nr:LEPR-XLL domain-containing protein [Tepidisphaeraceae bacterium]
MKLTSRIEALESRMLLSADYAIRGMAAFPKQIGGTTGPLVSPVGAPAFDTAGNLYGVASDGGDTGNGGLFELAKGSHAIVDLASLPAGARGSEVTGIAVDQSGNIW